MNTTIEDTKRQAKRIARATTVTHAQALDVLAVQNGYSHWQAYSKALSERPVASAPTSPSPLAAPYVSMATGLAKVIETILGIPTPAIQGCRHLLLSGTAATGKTTFMNIMLATIGDTMRVVAVEETRELRLRGGGTSLTISRTDSERNDARTISEALALRPDMLFVSEISTSNAVPLVEAMTLKEAPIIVTAIHAGNADHIGDVLSSRAEYAGRPDVKLPRGVAILQIERDAMTGSRRVTSITRS